MDCLYYPQFFSRKRSPFFGPNRPSVRPPVLRPWAPCSFEGVKSISFGPSGYHMTRKNSIYFLVVISAASGLSPLSGGCFPSISPLQLDPTLSFQSGTSFTKSTVVRSPFFFLPIESSGSPHYMGTPSAPAIVGRAYFSQCCKNRPHRITPLGRHRLAYT